MSISGETAPRRQICPNLRNKSASSTEWLLPLHRVQLNRDGNLKPWGPELCEHAIVV